MGALGDLFDVTKGMRSGKKRSADPAPAGGSGDPDPIASYSKERGGSPDRDDVSKMLQATGRGVKRAWSKVRS